MRIISRRTLREFWEKHADSEQQLKAWFRETEKASRKNINELKVEYPSASVLKDNKIVFNNELPRGRASRYRINRKINAIDFC